MNRAEKEANKRYNIIRGDDTEETSVIDMQRALDFIDGYHQAVKEIIQWIRNHYGDYMYNPTGKKLEAFFWGDMITDLEKFIQNE